MRHTLFFCFLLLLFNTGFTQPCYTRLSDASGVNTDTNQTGLSGVACALRSVLPPEFQAQFSVYDFGFYLHQENFQGAYAALFTQKVQQIAAITPYYLIFGKQTDQTGIYSTFWVELKLPATGRFACLSSLERDVLYAKIRAVTNQIHEQNNRLASAYFVAENGAMDTLRNRLEHIIDCCYAKSEDCSQCPSFEDQDALFKDLGFREEAVTIAATNGTLGQFDPEVVHNYACNNYAVTLTGGQTKTVNQLITDFLTNEVPPGETAFLTVTTKDNFCNGGTPCDQLDFGTVRDQFLSSTAHIKKWIHLYNGSNNQNSHFYTLKKVTGGADQLVLRQTVFHEPAPNPAGWVRIKKDGLSGEEISGEHYTASWSKGSDGDISTKPVAYVSGNTAYVGAAFEVNGTNLPVPSPLPEGSPSGYFARGTCQDISGAKLPEQELQAVNGVFVYPVSGLKFTSNMPYFTPKQVRFFESFKIKWEISDSDKKTWSDAGTSNHRLYVTFQKPSNNAPHFYTCLHLGTSEANGQKTDAAIVQRIQSKFASKKITRVDDVEQNGLKYWGDKDKTRVNRGIEALLENSSQGNYEDGRCGGWVDFFEETLLTQGINGDRGIVLAYNRAGTLAGVFNDVLKNAFLTEVENFFGPELFNKQAPPANWLDNADPDNHPGSGARIILHGQIVNTGDGPKPVIISQFFVKKWQFNSGSKKFYSLGPASTTLQIQINSATTKSVSGAELPGVQAQGPNPNPVSNFDDHVLYKYKNQYYDPSYGTGPFATKTAWVTKSLSGYGTLLIYIDEDNLAYPLLWLDALSGAPGSENIITID